MKANQSDLYDNNVKTEIITTFLTWDSKVELIYISIVRITWLRHQDYFWKLNNTLHMTLLLATFCLIGLGINLANIWNRSRARTFIWNTVHTLQGDTPSLFTLRMPTPPRPAAPLIFIFGNSLLIKAFRSELKMCANLTVGYIKDHQIFSCINN